MGRVHILTAPGTVHFAGYQVDATKVIPTSPKEGHNAVEQRAGRLKVDRE